MKGDWIRAGLATVAVVVGGGEITARWLDTADDKYVPPVASDTRRPREEATLSRPNARFLWLGHIGRRREFEVFVRLNSFGFHDDEHLVAKSAGTRRVLVVGDSFVDAVQVPLQAGVPRLLARRLGAPGAPVEVIAVGHAGWGPIEYRAAIDEWAPKLDADAVVLCLYPGNDVRNSSPEAEMIFAQQRAGPLGELWARRPDRELAGVLLPSSRLNVLVARMVLLRRIRARIAAWDFPYKIPDDFYVFVQERIPFVEDAWRRFEIEVVGIGDDLARQGRPLLVVSTSDAFRIQSPARLRAQLDRNYPEAKRWHWDFDRFEQRLAAILGKSKIRYLDLHARFAERMRGTEVIPHYPADGHWNETGHRWAAEELGPEVAALLAR